MDRPFASALEKGVPWNQPCWPASNRAAWLGPVSGAANTHQGRLVFRELRDEMGKAGFYRDSIVTEIIESTEAAVIRQVSDNIFAMVGL